jgi:hypothetical protein
MDATDALLEAQNELERLGLTCVGRSSKSEATYWAIFDQDDEPRLRLATHAVAYESSDCSVCLGTSQDDDVALNKEDIAGCVQRAVELLLDATFDRRAEAIADDLDRDRDDFADRDATPDELTTFRAIAATEAKAEITRHGRKWRKEWAKIAEAR